MTRQPSTRTRSSPGTFTALLALLGALLVVPLILAPRAAGFVYWPHLGDRLGGSLSFAIGRANLDDSGVDFDFLPLPGLHGTVSSSTTVAVDASHVYWDSSSADVGRANLDGTAGELGFIEAGDAGVCDVVVDANHLYWSNDSSDAPAIARANLDGTGVSLEFIPTPDVFCTELAIDDAHLYWTTSLVSGGGAIARANLDGSGADQSFMALPEAPCGIAVDAARVYWTYSGFSGMSPGTIASANLDGTGVSQYVVGGHPCELAVDGAHIYWVNNSGGFSGGSIGRANLDGTAANRHFIPDSGGQPADLAVDALRSSSFGKLKKDKRRGTATLTVNVPAPGDLRLAATRWVKGKRKRSTAAGQVKLPIEPKRETKAKLRSKGNAQVTAKVTYTPDGVDPSIVATTDTKPLDLVRRTNREGIP